MQINLLTPVEEQLMLLLWKLDSFYMKDVLESHPEPKPHQNTISTYLKILVEKQFLSAEKEGRIFHYKVALPSATYRKFLLDMLINHYYGGQTEQLAEDLGLGAKEQPAVNNSEKSLQKEAPANKDTEKNAIADFVSELTDGKKKKDKKKNKKDKKKKK